MSCDEDVSTRRPRHLEVPRNGIHDCRRLDNDNARAVAHRSEEFKNMLVQHPDAAG